MSKLYTTREIAEMTNHTDGAVSQFFKKRGIEPVEKRGKSYVWSQGQVDLIVDEKGSVDMDAFKPTIVRDGENLWSTSAVAARLNRSEATVSQFFKKRGIEPYFQDGKKFYWHEMQVDLIEHEKRVSRIPKDLKEVDLPEYTGIDEVPESKKEDRDDLEAEADRRDAEEDREGRIQMIRLLKANIEIQEKDIEIAEEMIKVFRQEIAEKQKAIKDLNSGKVDVDDLVLDLAPRGW